MAKPSHFNTLLKSVSADVLAHPTDLTKFYADMLGISRVAANAYIQRLEREGWIARSGPKTRPIFSLGYKKTITKVYALQGLEEHVVLEQDFMPFLNLSKNVSNIISYGFTEMLNNAIDHSGGKTVNVSVLQTDSEIFVYISDNGIGVFKKITDTLGLSDMRQAIFELSKGKLTTDAKNHTGEGVFFTSRIFDTYLLWANDLLFSHSDHDLQDELIGNINHESSGTSIIMSIALNSTRTTTEIFQQYMQVPDDYDFSKTVVPMKLAAYGSDLLVSRSQAKRLIARFDRFKIVELDFADVEEVGQAFADELFRVYANEHPATELVPKNMTREVERMYLRAVAPRM
jgi:anti-sigma regulatory factor (Ser/Thr protein kinase)